MRDDEIEKLAEIQDTHWWYRERRAVLARQLARFDQPGVALDVGSAGGHNTQVMGDLGWRAMAIDASGMATRIGRSHGITVVQGDGTQLPFAAGSLDLVVAYDVLEHINDDAGMVREVQRVLRPAGTFLVAVPADPRLWSAHDVAVDHLRRYTAEGLRTLLGDNGFEIRRMWSWNVLMRPALMLRRRNSSGSDLDEVQPWLNRVLHGVIRLERYLPLDRFPGVSLFLEAHPHPLPADSTPSGAEGRRVGAADRTGPKVRPAMPKTALGAA